MEEEEERRKQLNHSDGVELIGGDLGKNKNQQPMVYKPEDYWRNYPNASRGDPRGEVWLSRSLDWFINQQGSIPCAMCVSGVDWGTKEIVLGTPFLTCRGA